MFETGRFVTCSGTAVENNCKNTKVKKTYNIVLGPRLKRSVHFNVWVISEDGEKSFHYCVKSNDSQNRMTAY